jgi:histone H3/H4
LISPAFLRAERTRRRSRLASPSQKGTITRLAREGGVETPEGVRWSHQASDVIKRLLKHLREPTLGLRWVAADE